MMDNNDRSNQYRNKAILAPMVRANSLPFRLLCLRAGADLVYSEELIDYKFEKCRRIENKCLGTIDFVDDRDEVVFRTCAEEKDRVIVQFGSNNPERALRAAKIVCDDVCGVDFNFGCPKSFSLSGGMGAAMLEKPDEIKALLTKCVTNLDIPVTCKIRLLPDLDKTLELVKMIEVCGVSAIAVHGRTKCERSKQPNNDDALRSIAAAISIPMIANGGSNRIVKYSDMIQFRDNVKASSVMIARAAQTNPSIFKPDGHLEPIDIIIKDFIKLAVQYDNYLHLTKYTIQTFLSRGSYGSEFVSKFHASSDMQAICELFDMVDWYEQNKVSTDIREFYASKLKDEELTKLVDDKRKQLELDTYEFICDHVPYHNKLYGSVKPKAQLIEYYNKHRGDKPLFFVFQLKPRFFHCIVKFGGKCYLNRALTKNKKDAEHASSMLVCEKLGIVELKAYRTRSESHNKSIHQ